MQTTPRTGEPGILMMPDSTAPGGYIPRASRVLAVETDGEVIAEEVVPGTQTAVTYFSRRNTPFVPVGGTPPATGRYFQQVDYSA
jgi:hypothetical protein